MDEQKMERAFRASELIVKYLKGDLTAQEQQELDSWVEESEANRELFSELTNPGRLNLLLTEFYKTDKKAASRKVMRRLFPGQVNRFKPRSMMWRYISVAAAILVLVATIVYINRQPSHTKATKATNEQLNNIAPGDGKQVILTLGDGSTIQIDKNTSMGVVAQQGKTQIIRQKDGQIIYQAGNGSAEVISDNSIETPKGRQHEVVLPDGSKVWLNALSRLNFPTAFTGKSRTVSLSGEAYFDIVADKSKPFHVKVDGLDVKVTGTEFNINAYKDETLVRSTLFEGAVKITREEVSFELAPGQQLQLDQKTRQVKVVNADLEGTAAWKNGLFYVDNMDIASLMRQVERWYDIKVEYPNGVPSVYLIGEIYRNTNLLDLINVLNEGGIKARLDGKTLFVLQ